MRAIFKCLQKALPARRHLPSGIRLLALSDDRPDGRARSHTDLPAKPLISKIENQYVSNHKSMSLKVKLTRSTIDPAEDLCGEFAGQRFVGALHLSFDTIFLKESALGQEKIRSMSRVGYHHLEWSHVTSFG